jgi:hypothetical protein
MQNLLILGLIAIIAYFVYSKRQANARAKTAIASARSLSAKSAYRCVMINPGLNNCKSAQAMRLKPILMSEAPVLPLATCDSSQCDCQYSRHEDRRMEDRRMNTNTTRQAIGEATNFRQTPDRRKSLAQMLTN